MKKDNRMLSVGIAYVATFVCVVALIAFLPSAAEAKPRLPAATTTASKTTTTKTATKTTTVPPTTTTVPPTTTTTTTSGTSTLSVWIDGWGSGVVTSSPAGINCHLKSGPGSPWENENWSQSLTGPCEAKFPIGTVVTVTATPDPDNYLNAMDCGEPNNPCRKTITSGYNAVWVMFCPRDDSCSAG